ncbi:hypothetical protein SAMN05444285_12359 [Draconibacterium orientale]|uniref:Uncharacterized protein n=1 Tax=Draconibacterium orientale TaxID=1168034 RepID=X5E3W1_9BACT|nr:hypothetical protein [Draconibacterium orientale]AHW62150.1 hypothetical protein FH5T_16200 [Draconibacterium orientale]SET78920.1 hypothetical protein SAMN05444285_12359 [Draconibacterium orientale]
MNESKIHSTLDDGYDFFINDKKSKEYHFKIASFAVPSGLLSEAIEVKEEDLENLPRKFHVLSNFDEDVEKVEMLLKAKIKKAINQVHLIKDYGEWQISENTLRGTIDSTDKLSDSEFNTVFEIDGKRITIEEFVKMLESYEAFKFKFQIFDSTDSVD